MYTRILGLGAFILVLTIVMQLLFSAPLGTVTPGDLGLTNLGVVLYALILCVVVGTTVADYWFNSLEHWPEHGIAFGAVAAGIGFALIHWLIGPPVQRFLGDIASGGGFLMILIQGLLVFVATSIVMLPVRLFVEPASDRPVTAKPNPTVTPKPAGVPDGKAKS
jgi:uncharacterized BrkB/YihY/UPF0761 family membrane protein